MLQQTTKALVSWPEKPTSRSENERNNFRADGRK